MNMECFDWIFPKYISCDKLFQYKFKGCYINSFYNISQYYALNKYAFPKSTFQVLSEVHHCEFN